MLGKLNRIDLRVATGVDVDAYRRKLATRLPPGVVAVAPEVERDRAVTVTRAYRVNLNMLALVALWTGAFLVFSTQSLSVMRRLKSIAVLRALGMTTRQVHLALVGEGVFLGACGALLGILGGIAAADVLLRLLTGDLGNGQLRTAHSMLSVHTAPLVLFFLIGTAVASLGAWFPSRAASRRPPAQALKGGDVMGAAATRRASRVAIVLLIAGALLARAPAWHGLPAARLRRHRSPSGGCSAVGADADGSHLESRAAYRARLVGHGSRAIARECRTVHIEPGIDHRELQPHGSDGNHGLLVPSVVRPLARQAAAGRHSNSRPPTATTRRTGRRKSSNALRRYRVLRESSSAAHASCCSIPARQSVTLIARDIDTEHVADALPLVQSVPVRADEQPVWISEALQDLYGLHVGQRLNLPLGESMHSFRVAGVWRDYARSFGALVILRSAYVDATADANATEAAAWLTGTHGADEVERSLRAAFDRPDLVEIMTSSAVRERSLQIFDRAFVITYAIEAIAVFIGLAGVSFAASSTALARRAEFGMLRHIGMLRRQVIGMLATEGLLMSAFGVLYGLALGSALSLVLIYVVNRQSFNWSIDFAVPYWQLALLGVSLISAAAVTAIWSGRAALATDALRAVREDW